MQPTPPAEAVPETDPSQLLTDTQVARALGVSLRTAKEYRYTGLLASVKLPGAWGPGRPSVRVRRQDLDAFIARHREPSRHEPRRTA